MALRFDRLTLKSQGAVQRAQVAIRLIRVSPSHSEVIPAAASLATPLTGAKIVRARMRGAG